MRTSFTLAALTLASLTTPATAQQTDRVLVIFGTDKCPTNASGEEIVVCARRPESERFRIPKELREGLVITPENEAWAARAQSLDSVGREGIGSCSPVGAGGWTGCYNEQVRQARADRAQRETERSDQPR